MFLKVFNSEFWDVEVWFIDQISQPLKIEDGKNSILVIKWYRYYRNGPLNWTKRSNICKSYGFLSFAENIGRNLSKKYSQKLLDSA